MESEEVKGLVLAKDFVTEDTLYLTTVDIQKMFRNKTIMEDILREINALRGDSKKHRREVMASFINTITKYDTPTREVIRDLLLGGPSSAFVDNYPSAPFGTKRTSGDFRAEGSLACLAQEAVSPKSVSKSQGHLFERRMGQK